MFRYSADNKPQQVPTEPYNGVLDISKVGGYAGVGEKVLGSTTISNNTALNQSGIISTITDSQKFTVYSWATDYDTITADSEIILHISEPISNTTAVDIVGDYPLVGLYAVVKVHSIDGITIVLDREITTENGYDFMLNSTLPKNYRVQVISVPCFDSLIINGSITPAEYIAPVRTFGHRGAVNSFMDTKNDNSPDNRGGIVALRINGDCIINGSILTSVTGPFRFDIIQMTHSKLVDRFLIARGGGIFITCDGTFIAPTTARIAATWSVLGENGNGVAGY